MSNWAKQPVICKVQVFQCLVTQSNIILIKKMCLPVKTIRWYSQKMKANILKVRMELLSPKCWKGRLKQEQGHLLHQTQILCMIEIAKCRNETLMSQNGRGFFAK